MATSASEPPPKLSPFGPGAAPPIEERFVASESLVLFNGTAVAEVRRRARLQVDITSRNNDEYDTTSRRLHVPSTTNSAADTTLFGNRRDTRHESVRDDPILSNAAAQRESFRIQYNSSHSHETVGIARRFKAERRTQLR